MPPYGAESDSPRQVDSPVSGEQLQTSGALIPLKVKRGAIRGTRLIVYASLMDYLRSLEQMEKLCA